MLVRLLFYFVFSLLCSCTGENTQREHGGDTIPMKYAENIMIVKYSHYTLVDIKNPWKKGERLHRYIILNDKRKVSPLDYPQGTIIGKPLTRSVVFGTAHASLFLMLNAELQMAGVCDLKYMLLPPIHSAVKKGIVVDCGDGMMPDIEKIVSVKADGLFVSPFENSGGYGLLDKLDIPIIECADYMEKSALGRAEWMKFYGLLLGREAEADSLFRIVETSYMRCKKEMEKSRDIPLILTEKKNGNTWYVPGGKSTIATMLKDAGSKYCFESTLQSGSIPLNVEVVLEKASEADYWLFTYNSTKEYSSVDLLSEYEGYRMIKAFKKKNVWICNTAKVPYFEEVPFRPDYLLADYAILFHQVRGINKPRYFKLLK